MENLSHTLFGAALAETRLGKRTPLALATALIGANLPDLDVLAYFGGSDSALAHRRGWTHGPLAMVLLPLALTGLLLAWDRTIRRRRLPGAPPASSGPVFLLSAVAVLSHPALDWLNTYGVRLLMPFDGRWFYGDALFIADPWLWLVLGGGVVLARRSRGLGLASWAVLGALCAAVVIAASSSSLALRLLWLAGLAMTVLLRLMPRRLPPGERLAAVAVAAVVVYGALMTASAAAARTLVERELARRGTASVGPIAEVLAGPQPLDPLTRDIVAAGEKGYLVGRFRWLGEPRLVLSDQLLPRGDEESAVVRAALAAPCVQGMVQWLRYPIFSVEPSASGWDVWILDARYTRQRTTGFGGARVELSRDLKPAVAGKR
jgi:inner membrane protein